MLRAQRTTHTTNLLLKGIKPINGRLSQVTTCNLLANWGISPEHFTVFSTQIINLLKILRMSEIRSMEMQEHINADRARYPLVLYLGFAIFLKTRVRLRGYDGPKTIY